MKKVFATIAIGCLIAAVASLAQLPKPGNGGGSSSGGTAGTDFAKPSLYDTYANVAAETCGAAESGQLAFTTNSIYTARCNGTAWQWSYKGQPVTIPPSSGWSTDGSATITASHAGGYAYLSIPANANPNVGLYIRAIPSAPYTVTALIRVNAAMSDFYHGGLAVAQASTDEQQYIGLLCEGGNRIGSHFWGTFTGTVSTIGTMRPWFDNELWVRIADNATNRIQSWSMDGLNWVQHSSETNTTNLTPDGVGFQMNSQNSQIVTMMVISYSVE